MRGSLPHDIIYLDHWPLFRPRMCPRLDLFSRLCSYAIGSLKQIRGGAYASDVDDEDGDEVEPKQEL